MLLLNHQRTNIGCNKRAEMQAQRREADRENAKLAAMIEQLKK